MKKNILYRSPVRGYGDSFINEPEAVYFGFVERVPLTDLTARSSEITAKMEALQTPCVVDGVLYFPADDRPPERYEVFPPDSTDVLVMIRVALRQAPTSQADLN